MRSPDPNSMDNKLRKCVRTETEYISGVTPRGSSSAANNVVLELRTVNKRRLWPNALFHSVLQPDAIRGSRSRQTRYWDAEGTGNGGAPTAAQAPCFALPPLSVTLIPIGGGACQRRVFRIRRALAAKREESILTRHVLLGDIGATNARFALLANGALGPVKSLDVAKFPRFAYAAATFLNDHCQQIEITNAVLAVAGPIEGERCVLTNCSWVIDARELYETFRLEARIVNDFGLMLC